jgi:GntR family transcriptional regulator
VKIDKDAPEFPYVQLAAILREQIRSGDLAARQKIPPLTVLEQQYGLSTMTVRRAIAVLIDEGLVQTVPGRGTFVTRSSETPHLQPTGASATLRA